MDLFAAFAAIASDPSALPLWLVVMFAAGMYPVGMLFGCEVCCNYCVNCCPDDIEQVVIDFHLEALGAQVVKQTPWRMMSSLGNWVTYDPMNEITDELTPNFWGAAPTFILTGDTSGGRIMARTGSQWIPLIPGDNSSYVYRYWPELPGASMGKAAAGQTSDFVNESITVSTAGPAEQLEEPAYSVTVDAGGCVETITESAHGLYSEAEPFPDYTVDCQGDEGTVIYDVPDGRPEGCNTSCVPFVRRGMNHPAKSRLDAISSWPLGGTLGPQIQETSILEVSVPVITERQKWQLGLGWFPWGCISQHGGDGSTVTATATTYWASQPLASGLTYPAWCETVRQYTLDTTEQDCVPFENWSYTDTTTDSDGEYEDDLVRFTVTSCFGSGFAGRATLPAGVPGEDDGPIGAVEITNPGTGYAVLGRVEPTATVTSISGTGADLVVTFTETADECGLPLWTIASIAIASGSGDDGGEGYTDGENLSITVDAPGVEVTPAVAVALTVHEEPVLELSSSYGSNAELTFSLEQFSIGPVLYWMVTGATVDSVGSGYQFGEHAFIQGATPDDITANSGRAFVETLVSEPTLTLSGGSGSGADLGVTVASNGVPPPPEETWMGISPETWGITAVSIVDGGTGYEVGDTLTVSFGEDDVQRAPATVTVSSVDSNGAITGVTIDAAGEYYYESGHVAGLVIDIPGAFYRVSGTLAGVEVTNGGAYYLEDPEAPAIVADITLNIEQLSPSAGTGLAVTATVDDEPGSATFGQITDLTIDDAGDGYLAIHSEPSVCHVGAPFRRVLVTRRTAGLTEYLFEIDDFSGSPADKPQRGILFRRRCPDYTYEISLQAGSS